MFASQSPLFPLPSPSKRDQIVEVRYKPKRLVTLPQQVVVWGMTHMVSYLLWVAILFAMHGVNLCMHQTSEASIGQPADSLYSMVISLTQTLSMSAVACYCHACDYDV